MNLPLYSPRLPGSGRSPDMADTRCWSTPTHRRTSGETHCPSRSVAWIHCRGNCPRRAVRRRQLPTPAPWASACRTSARRRRLRSSLRGTPAGRDSTGSRPCSVMCHQRPFDLLPVERGSPVRLSYSTPAVRQPKACFVISTASMNSRYWPLVHWLWRQRKGFQKGAMVRCLVCRNKALASGSNGKPCRREIRAHCEDGGCLDFQRIGERQGTQARAWG
jgi:hypothetical protein